MTTWHWHSILNSGNTSIYHKQIPMENRRRRPTWNRHSRRESVQSRRSRSRAWTPAMYPHPPQPHPPHLPCHPAWSQVPASSPCPIAFRRRWNENEGVETEQGREGRQFFVPVLLKCFASIHISKRNKTLQGHWMEWLKEQKITNGRSLCNYFIIFTLVVNIVNMFVLNAYPVWILNGL